MARRANFPSTQGIFDSTDPNLYSIRYNHAMDKALYWKVETRSEQRTAALRSSSAKRRAAASRERKAGAKPRVDVVFNSSLKLSGAEKMWNKPESANYYYHRLIRVVGSKTAIMGFLDILQKAGYSGYSERARDLDDATVAWSAANSTGYAQFNTETERVVSEVKKEYKWTWDDLVSEDYDLVKKVTKAVSAKLKEVKKTRATSRARSGARSRAKKTDVQKKMANRKKILHMFGKALDSRGTIFYDPSGVKANYIGNKSFSKEKRQEDKYIWDGALAVLASTTLSNGEVSGFRNVRRALDEALSSGDVEKEYGVDARQLASDLRSNMDSIEKSLSEGPRGGRQTSFRRRQRRPSRQPQLSSAERMRTRFETESKSSQTPPRSLPATLAPAPTTPSRTSSRAQSPSRSSRSSASQRSSGGRRSGGTARRVSPRRVSRGGPRTF